MAILRSATKKDPSLLVPEGDDAPSEKSLCPSNLDVVPTTIDSSSSSAKGTPPSSDGKRKEFPGLIPLQNQRAPASTRKSLQFASKSQEFSCDGETIAGKVDQCRESGHGNKQEPPDCGLGRLPVSRMAEKTSAAVRDEGKRSFPSDEHSFNQIRRNARLATKKSFGFEVDSGKNIFASGSSEQYLQEKDGSEHAGELESDQEQKILENEGENVSTRKCLGRDSVGNEGDMKSDGGRTVGKKRIGSLDGKTHPRRSRRIASKHAVVAPHCVYFYGYEGADGNSKDVISRTEMEIIDLNEPAVAGSRNEVSMVVDLDRPDIVNLSNEQNEESHAMDSVAIDDDFDNREQSVLLCSVDGLSISKGSSSKAQEVKGKEVVVISNEETKSEGSELEKAANTLRIMRNYYGRLSDSELIVEQNANEESLKSEEDKIAPVIPDKSTFKIEDRRHQRERPEWKRRENRKIGVSYAREFAHCNAERAEASSRIPAQNGTDSLEAEDWPGPFSTAKQIARTQKERLAARLKKLSGCPDSAPIIDWTPSRQGGSSQVSRPCPSLRELCRWNLCKHIEDVVSLEGIPDEFLIEIGHTLCASRKMDSLVLGQILEVSQSEVSIPDCSNVTEEALEKAWFGMHNLHQLRVLHLDLSGRCISDNLLQSACSSQKFSCLISLSLKGAYRLTDGGLLALISAAPALESINLSDCTSFTEAGIYELTIKLELSLKELYIDGCQQLDARAMLDSLLNLKMLEVLSVAGIQTVNDVFMSGLVSVHGPKLKVLIVADCRELTDVSISNIATNCPLLNTLNLTNLSNLTDDAICHLADGCRSIQVLAISRCPFSDEAISAYLEVCGECLTDFSANGVREVAHNTALSISSCCRKRLLRLDLSWCRKLTDEALGLIADSCESLQELRLFGCTQVTSKFLDGYSNLKLQIVGLRDSCLIPKGSATLYKSLSVHARRMT